MGWAGAEANREPYEAGRGRGKGYRFLGDKCRPDRVGRGLVRMGRVRNTRYFKF